jgi:hypothetical protein
MTNKKAPPRKKKRSRSPAKKWENEEHGKTYFETEQSDEGEETVRHQSRIVQDGALIGLRYGQYQSR